MDYEQRIEQSKEALRLEETLRAPYDVTAGMDQDSMKRFIDYLMEQKREDDLEKRAMRNVLEELSGNFEKLSADFNAISDKLGKALEELASVKKELKAANKKALKYEELYRREVQNRFGNRQKKTPAKCDKDKTDDNSGNDSSHDTPDREQERENFDGTGNAVAPENGNDGTGCQADPGAPTSRRNADLSNRSSKYKGIGANCDVTEHPCDVTGLGEVLDRRTVTIFNLKTVLSADSYEMVKVRAYKTDPATGKRTRTTEWVYRGCPGHPASIPAFKGTHATPEFIQALAYEVYLKGTTLGNIHKWLSDLGMSVSKSTLNHWLRKGKKKLDKIIVYIKELAVEKDSVVNCDETWCKVRRYDRYRKCYLWVLVNRQNKMVIFFYDNGSRGSRVLRDFLGDAEIKCLVSDGYVGYKFIDRNLEQWKYTDHIIDWAHIRAKFVEAIESGCDDPIAGRLLEYINRLFKLEDEYRREGLSPEQVAERRQSPETKSVVNRLYADLLSAVKNEDQYRSPLLDTALRYMYNNWEYALTYLKDGRYPIDNNAAERSVRPFCARRNSFEHFGSDIGAEMAAAYHSVIGTLNALGISAWHGLGKLFTEVIDSASDFLRVLGDTKSLTPA